MDWFKYHAHTLTNAKAQRLSGSLFKFWVNCMSVACLHNPRGEIPPQVDDLALAVHLPPARTAEYLEELIRLAFVDRVGDRLLMHDWEYWQADTSADRSKRYRHAQSQTVTERHAPSRTVTPRGEEKRREVEEKREDPPSSPPVGRLVDTYRALPGITPTDRDGGIIAGLVKKYGLTHLEAVLRDVETQIGAADRPLLYLAGACRRPREQAVKQRPAHLDEQPNPEHAAKLAELTRTLAQKVTMP